MSDVFALDEAGARSLADQAAANPVLPADISTGMWHGSFKALGEGAMRGFTDIARLGELSGGAVAGFAEPFLGYRQGELTDQYYSLVDPTIKNAVDYWTPGPNEVGSAARVLGGLSEGLTMLGAGGGNPALMIGGSEATGAMSLAEQGVNPDVATGGGILEGVANAAGFKMPFLGRSLLTRMASGAAGNLAIGRAATLAQQQLLEHTGNEKLAEGYNPWDLSGATLDALMGLAYGGIAHVTSPVRPIERDAALALLNAKHFQEDAAPGRPADLASSVAHQEAIEQAIHQILNGDPVTPPAAVMGAGFVRTPPADRLAPIESTVTRAAQSEQLDHIVQVLSGAKERGFDLATDLRNLDAAREGEIVHELTPRELVSAPPVPVDEIQASELPPEAKQQLTEMYGQASQAKPVIDRAMREISEEIGTPHKPLFSPLKNVARAVSKVLSDYGGAVGRLKDLARGSIVADNHGQVQAAIEGIERRFGRLSKMRNTLDPSAMTGKDGYRDANVNVQVNGHTVELQVSVPEMVAAKKKIHAQYEERQVIERKVAAEGRDATPEEAARIDELNRQMAAVTLPAWEAFLRRAKETSSTGVPSDRASAGENRRPPGTSQAMQAAPPSGVGRNETGTPSTSQNSGSLPSINAPPTGEIIAKSEGSRPPEIGKEIKGEQGPDPDIETARQLLEKYPDLKVATGEFTADGRPITESARELLDRGEAEVADAQNQREGYKAAVECALQVDAA